MKTYRFFIVIRTIDITAQRMYNYTYDNGRIETETWGRFSCLPSLRENLSALWVTQGTVLCVDNDRQNFFSKRAVGENLPLFYTLPRSFLQNDSSLLEGALVIYNIFQNRRNIVFRRLLLPTTRLLFQTVIKVFCRLQN